MCLVHEFIKTIQVSIKYDIGKACEINKPFEKELAFTSVRDMWKNKYLKLPYPVCFFQMDTKNGRVAILACEENKNWHLIIVFATKDVNPASSYTWVVLPVIIHIENLPEIGKVVYTYPPQCEGIVFDEGCKKIISVALTALRSAILLLNCKNITTETHKPDEALNKARRKRGKQELFTYKTLKLLLPGKKEKHNLISEPTGEHNRIHYCRGHFKEYTAEAPLFGKITGLWWWQPSVRGKNKDGVVIKDYNIAVNAQGDACQQSKIK